MRFWTNGAQQLIIDNAGRITNSTATVANSGLALHSDANVNESRLTTFLHTTATTGPQLQMRKSRGTEVAPTAVETNDQLGVLAFLGYDTVGYESGCQIRSYAEENWSATANGSYLAFRTRAAGGTEATDKMNLTSTGKLSINQTVPTAQLHIQGGAYDTLTGTVSVTNSVLAVVGTATQFVDELAVGDSVRIFDSAGASTIYTVATITDQTNLTLDTTYSGATEAGLRIAGDDTLLCLTNADGVTKLSVAKDGSVGINTDTPAAQLDIVAEAGANDWTVVQGTRYAANCRISGRRANGTSAAPTILLTGEPIMRIQSWGYGGSGFNLAGEIRTEASDVWADGVTYDTDMTFHLATGTSSTEKLRIASDGVVTTTAPVVLTSYTVATLPAVGAAGGMIFVTDEPGGAVMAFSDGASWRRCTDRTVVSINPL